MGYYVLESFLTLMYNENSYNAFKGLLRKSFKIFVDIVRCSARTAFSAMRPQKMHPDT